MMRVLLKSVMNAAQKICYPFICIYCHKFCDSKRYIFCKECFDLIDILEKEERCSCCFSASDEPYCLSCMHQTNIKQAYVSEQGGPLYVLLEKILKGQHYRVSAIAALMAYQYIKLDFSLPDYIVPNLYAYKKLSVLLAKEISKILQVPYRRFFLKKLLNTRALLISFQMDQSYDRSMQAIKKLKPKTLMGFTLIGPSSF